MSHFVIFRFYRSPLWGVPHMRARSNSKSHQNCLFFPKSLNYARGLIKTCLEIILCFYDVGREVEVIMAKETLTQEAEKVIEEWLKDPYDEEIRKEIKELIAKNPAEANDAFTTEIQFGTGGLRAKMGPGPGRMNNYTIQTVTQGLANYIRTFPKDQRLRGVVVCHDCRIHSREFAEETARVLAGNEIHVYLVPELRPTPFCSFAVRHYKALAGINITASHNPREYNGYKVYWSDGAQVVSPHDNEIIASIEKVKSIKEVKLSDLDSRYITTINKNCDEAYLKAVLDLTLFPQRDRDEGKKLSIVYSPLYGAGMTMIPEALKRLGFTNLHVVKEQQGPDGTFPTAPYPNPEMDEALQLGWRDLKAQNADILLVSDPDSDRLSCSILHHGKPRKFTGNELGALLLHNLIYHLKPAGKWASITTIVSSPLIAEMTKRHKGTCFEVLTGFKYIGELIHQWENEPDGYQFLFGMEESLGYLFGTYARDKDATIAAVLTAETALELKNQHMTLLDQLYTIYEVYGIFREEQRTIESKAGMEPMLKKLAQLRLNPPKEIAGIKVERIEDYQVQKSTVLKTGETKHLSLPKSNVLSFMLENQWKLIIRPSGTEPKLKIYGHARAPHEANIERALDRLEKELADLLSHFEKTHFPN